MAPPPYSPPIRSSPFRQRPYGTDNKDLLATFTDPVRPRYSQRKTIIIAVIVLILLVIIPVAIFLAVKHNEDQDNSSNCVQVGRQWINGDWSEDQQDCS